MPWKELRFSVQKGSDTSTGQGCGCKELAVLPATQIFQPLQVNLVKGTALSKCYYQLLVWTKNIKFGLTVFFLKNLLLATS